MQKAETNSKRRKLFDTSSELGDTVRASLNGVKQNAGHRYCTVKAMQIVDLKSVA